MADKRNPRRGGRMPDNLAYPLKEVLFEFQRVGNILRVHAIDPVTGTEVIMIADPRQGEAAIKRLAARKLAYVLAKNRDKQAKLDGKKSKGYNRIV